MPVVAVEGRQALSHLSHLEVRRGEYHDSVTLMLAGRAVAAVAGVERVLVAMGTELNIELLTALGYPPPEAGPADLLIAFTCPDQDGEAAALSTLTASLTPGGSITASGHQTPAQHLPRTTGSALGRTSAPLTLISTPGLASVPEAMEALQYGASVVIFSDNIPIHHEIRLKEEARRRGLLVMGPDCGTVVLQGIGFGFANTTRPGPISLVAASGTGAQQMMSLLDAAGTGIRHCLGVGGRDLTEPVAGRSTHAALDILAEDDETTLIAIVSKPPHPAVARSIEEHAARLAKPVVFAFIDPDHPTLTATTERILTALHHTPPPAWPHWAPSADDDARVVGSDSGQAAREADTGRTIRGLFSGGTLCAEAGAVLTRMRTRLLADPTDPPTPFTLHLTDFGDDTYTRGRPHPMIDNTLRLRALAEAAADPRVGVLLLDVVLGRGAHPDPAGELVPAVVAARAERALPVVVSLCGTAGDPQGLERQARAFADAGAWVYLSNAEAAAAAARLVLRRRSGDE